MTCITRIADGEPGESRLDPRTRLAVAQAS